MLEKHSWDHAEKMFTHAHVDWGRLSNDLLQCMPAVDYDFEVLLEVHHEGEIWSKEVCNDLERRDIDESDKVRLREALKTAHLALAGVFKAADAAAATADESVEQAEGAKSKADELNVQGDSSLSSIIGNVVKCIPAKGPLAEAFASMQAQAGGYPGMGAAPGTVEARAMVDSAMQHMEVIKRLLKFAHGTVHNSLPHSVVITGKMRVFARDNRQKVRRAAVLEAVKKSHKKNHKRLEYQWIEKEASTDGSIATDFLDDEKAQKCIDDNKLEWGSKNATAQVVSSKWESHFARPAKSSE